jgi:hypothetical protein
MYVKRAKYLNSSMKTIEAKPRNIEFRDQCPIS